MKNVLRIFVLILNKTSFTLICLLGVNGVIHDIVGPAIYEKILAKMKISWAYESIWILWITCLGILLVTFFVKKFFQHESTKKNQSEDGPKPQKKSD